MNESPRASKRRKLETPNDAASGPSTISSSARKSGRLANQKTSLRNTKNAAEVEKPAKKAVKSTVNKTRGAGRPLKDAKETDVWDDIEGALGEDASDTIVVRRPASTRKKTRGSRTEDASSAGNETDELHAPEPTPRRARRGEASGKDVQEKKQAASARKTTRVTKGTNGSATPAKPTLTKKPTRSTTRDLGPDEEDELQLSTPLRLGRRPARFRADETIAETEDEATLAPPKSAAKTAAARRRLNRADHTNNRVEEEEELEKLVDISDQEQEQADVQLDGDDGMSVDGNSIVGSVLDPTEPSPFNKPSPVEKSKTGPLLHDIVSNLQAGPELDLLKAIVMERITGKRAAPLINLDDECALVHQLVEHTITAGEGNSMLIIGARGSGKTSLVNKVLSEVSKDHGEDYHVVRLNGFIHTDDKIALREIWRQLGKEMDLDEESGGVGKNYADTLITLLALLSHPSEQTGEHTDQIAKAVIFVMDEFDLFAQHPRQTLLYNLFDIAQSRKAPIAVLGLTTRIDVANSLEKRVKSRFSHRYVHLSLAKSFSAFQEMCKANLLIQSDQVNVEERGILETVKTPAKKSKKGAKVSVLCDWNANINALFLSKSFLTTHLAPTFYLTKSLPQVLNSFLLPTATLSKNTPLPLAPTTITNPPDSKLSIIPTLSTLALSLLISAARLDIIHDSDTCNFNMAYDEYITLASKARIQNGIGGMSVGGSMSKVWGKEVARREWEGLVELGFILPIVSGNTGAFGMVKCDVSLEEIGGVLASKEGKAVEKGLERWCKHL